MFVEIPWHHQLQSNQAHQRPHRRIAPFMTTAAHRHITKQTQLQHQLSHLLVQHHRIQHFQPIQRKNKKIS